MGTGCKMFGRPMNKYATCEVEFDKETGSFQCFETPVPRCRDRMTAEDCEGLPWPRPNALKTKSDAKFTAGIRCEWNQKSRYSSVCEEADILPCDLRHTGDLCQREGLLRSPDHDARMWHSHVKVC